MRRPLRVYWRVEDCLHSDHLLQKSVVDTALPFPDLLIDNEHISVGGIENLCRESVRYSILQQLPGCFLLLVSCAKDTVHTQATPARPSLTGQNGPPCFSTKQPLPVSRCQASADAATKWASFGALI